MTKTIQQIQTKFKWFQILWLVQAICISVNCYFTSLANLALSSTSKITVKFEISSYFWSIYGSSWLYSITYFLATVTLIVLIRSIFSFLKKQKSLSLNINWVTWSVLIPFVSHVTFAINAKKTSENLELKSKTFTQNYYLSIFNFIGTGLLFAARILYLNYEKVSNPSVPISVSLSFYSNLITSSFALISMYFVWKVLFELKDEAIKLS